MERIKLFLRRRLVALCLALVAVAVLTVAACFTYPPMALDGFVPLPPQALYGIQAAPDKVDLNTAPWEELMVLRGIGEVRAAAIVEEREQRGGFSSIEEIMEVKGIGEKTFEGVRELIMVP